MRKPCHCGAVVNVWIVAGIGMDDELDSVTDRHSDFEHPAAVVGADQHGESVEVEDADRMAVGVEHGGRHGPGVLGR